MEERTIFIEIFQPFAQYRNPFTFYYAQTYPLPPKSTIIGMLQNACNDWYGHEFGIENWWNLKVSVHGGFESVFWNYQQLIKGELGFTESGMWVNRHDKNPGGNIWLPLYGEGLTSQRVPIFQQELFNGHLYIFIRGDEKLIEKIKVSLENPNKVLYLGRSEDIVFIRSIKEVRPQEYLDISDLKLTYPTYILEKNFPIANRKYPVYSIPIKVLFRNNGQNVNHKSEITKETERVSEFKTVIYISQDLILKENTKIKCEFYEIDNKQIRIVDGGWL